MIKKTAIAAAACALAAGSGGAAASVARVPQYDQFLASANAVGAGSSAKRSFEQQGKLARHLTAKLKSADVGPRGLRSNFDARLGGNTFLWIKNGSAVAAKSATAPVKRSALADNVGRAAIKANASALVAGRTAIDSAKLVDVQDDGKGIVVARYQQRVNGLEVFNRQMAVLMDHDLSPKAISGYFAPEAQQLAAKKNPGSFSRSGADAVAIAFAQLGGQLSPAALQIRKTVGDYSLYNIPAMSGDYRLAAAPRVKQVLYASKDRLIPAYYVEISGGPFDQGPKDQYAFVIDADSGKVLFRNSQVAYEAYTYGVYADADGIHKPYDGPLGNDLEPVTAGPTGPFVRTPAIPNYLTLTSGPIASNDPWLGAGATETTGNNVDAYLDLDDYLLSDGQTHGPFDGYTPENGQDFRGAALPGGQFVYPYTPDADPATHQQREAAAVNLFYMNNWLHDWWYHNGFDEAAGNAQLDNYGRGGVDGDPIHAEGQDGSGTNNANMATPSDGGSPRMQMYIFNVVESKLTVNSPASVAGVLDHGTAQFGPQTFDLTQDVVAAVPDDGCTPLTNTAAVSGKIVLIARGACAFTSKVKAGQVAGAAGVIISNNAAGGGPIGFAGTDATITIPSLGISLEDGDALRAALVDGPVNVTMHELTKTNRDGTMDNGIIAHEWFHYVSNRLVGNANGLYNNQGRSMGEGWSDFSTMMLIVRPEDRLVTGNDHWQGVYSTGTYVDDNQYFGIRRAPYSTDMAVNPLTFKDIEDGVPLPTSAPIAFGQGGVDNAEVHNSGEIWANVLWEIYAALLNDPRYSFDQAQDRMKDYVIAGLKMTPNAPTFLEARDALLAVAAVKDEGDFELMAKAFAKRGMGFGAVAPDRGDDTHAGVVESFTPFGSSFAVDDVSMDFAFDNGLQGYCDLDGVLDAGETAQLTLTIRSTGTKPISGPITARLSRPAGVSFPEGDTITFNSLGLIGDTMTGTVLVRLDRASTAQSLPLQIEFLPVDGDDSVVEPDVAEIDLIVNYDLVPATKSDGMENPVTSQHDWTVGDLAASGLPSWSIVDGADLDGDGSFFDSGHVWYAPDNDATSDVVLTTPDLVVGSGTFTFGFTHYFQMELAGYYPDGTPVGWDGGIIEMSVDGGAWQDALESVDFPAVVTQGTGYNGSAIVFDPVNYRDAFVDYNTNGFEPVTLSYGTALAGHHVRLRFHEGSDEASGEFGWVVDNVHFTGITNKPFSAIADNAMDCTNRPTHVDAGADTSTPGAKYGETRDLSLSGTVNDLDGTSGLTYAWTQVSGPTVTISGADTLTPSFRVPRVDADTDLVFRLSVDDGSQTTSDDVTVTVGESPLPQADAGADQTVAGAKKNDKPTLMLNGTVTDVASTDGLTYQWTQVSGDSVALTDAQTLTPTIRVPYASAAKALAFRLTVSDGTHSTSDDVTVNVTPSPKSNGGGGSFGLGILLFAPLALLRRRRRLR
ncbi:M36 family metallopeptidase [Solimonas terrae]|uniref:Peptidase n=1 Tax=Solimonas terrae TaxID=1396819 RepID=A0A6M2BNF2_9GAMM|nr:M36 family metallopeptidase [Solimonas terrae]NGY03850.1 hypothetical protein [Solimonas terrae]